MGIEEFRFNLWTAITEAKVSRNIEGFIELVDTFLANLQDKPEAYEKLETHLKLTEDKKNTHMKDTEKALDFLEDGLHRRAVRDPAFAELMLWQLREIYVFISKLARDYHLFPEAVSETKHEG